MHKWQVNLNCRLKWANSTLFFSQRPAALRVLYKFCSFVVYWKMDAQVYIREVLRKEDLWSSRYIAATASRELLERKAGQLASWECELGRDEAAPPNHTFALSGFGRAFDLSKGRSADRRRRLKASTRLPGITALPASPSLSLSLCSFSKKKKTYILYIYFFLYT